MERRNNFLFLVLLVAVGVLLAAVLLRGGVERPAPFTGGPGVATADGSGGTPELAEGGAVRDDAAGRDPSADSVRRAVDAEPAPPPESIRLRGRLVADAGTGVDGVELVWRARGDFGSLAPFGPERGRGNVTARTDAEGRFEFDVPTSRRGTLTLDRAANLLFGTAARRITEVAAYDADADLGELPVHPAAVIVGRVVDETGQPVPAARVRANSDAFVFWLPGEGQSVDGEGVFELRGLEPGTQHLGAEASGFVPVTAAVEVGAGDVVEGVVLTLDRGASVAGTVLDDRGLPVAGARVAAFRNRAVGPTVEVQGIDTSHAVETDTTGYFVLTGIEGKSVALRAWADGHAARSVGEVDVGTGNAQIRLQRLGRITGVLLDTEGSPIEGSRVTARAFGGGRVVMPADLPDMEMGGPETRTDAEGRFEIDGVRPGTVSLDAHGPTHLPVEGYTVQVVPGATVANVMMRAEVGAGVLAHVVDADGRPVAGATVVVTEPPEPRLEQPAPGTGRHVAVRMGREEDDAGNVSVSPFDGPRELRRGETDTEGTVRIGGLPAGPVQVRAEGAGQAPSRPTELAVPRRGSVEAVLTLRPAGHIEVRTVTPAGEAAPEVGFVIHGPVGAEEVDQVDERGRTDAAGVARVGPLLAGTYTAVLSLPPRARSLGGGMDFVMLGSGGDELQETRAEVTVQAGEVTEIVMQRPVLARVFGTVQGASGPAAGVDVSLRNEGAPPFAPSWSATTGGDGAFSIPDVPAGTYEIEWKKPQQIVPQTDTLEVPPATSEVRRDLERRGGSVRVEVRSAVDGAPVAQAAVSLRRPGEQQRQQRGVMMVRTAVSTGGGATGTSSITMGGTPKVRTGPDGVAVVEDVPPGSYVLVVEHDKHADGRVEDVDVVDQRLTDAGVVELTGAGGVRGTVTGFPEDAEIRIAMIQVRKAGTEDEPRRETAMGGTFSIGRLEPGEYELRAERLGPGASGEAGPWRRVTVRAGEMAPVELPLSGS